MAVQVQTIDTDNFALSVQEAARKIGVGEALLWRLIRDGKIPSAKIGGRRVVPVDGLRAYLAAQVRQAMGGTANG